MYVTVNVRRGVNVQICLVYVYVYITYTTTALDKRGLKVHFLSVIDCTFNILYSGDR